MGIIIKGTLKTNILFQNSFVWCEVK